MASQRSLGPRTWTGDCGSEDAGGGVTSSQREGSEAPLGDAPLTAPRCCAPLGCHPSCNPLRPAHGDVTFGGGAEHDPSAATILSMPPDGPYDNV